MLYQIPVMIRVIAMDSQYRLDMREVVRYGQLMELDQIGFYLLGNKNLEYPPDNIRRHITTVIHGSVVVSAENVYEAIGRFYQHPGVRGTGREKPEKKAIKLNPSVHREIIEVPPCDLNEEFESGCFHINEDGWAQCKYVENDPINKLEGYCHCLLQEADEPPTGCEIEEYFNNLDPHTPVRRTLQIRYLPVKLP